ncbi:hypothetical protein BSF37_03170 [Serratia marcescens]|uniref:hypothetical protein n=1 Tax=Serratia marcescens TaxID=615 RepID=UPI00147E4430|nr:hypothetical protein [Serratia marcescens]NMM70787.1 hypothetical protein [Serratia marcescens]
MDNKLSELSKPVAWTDERGNLCTNRNKERGLESRYHQDYEKYTTPFYSQEYVSALLAEIGEKERSLISNCVDYEYDLIEMKRRAEAAEQRVAELEVLLDRNIKRAKKLGELLDTPVQLQNCDFESVAIMAHWCTDEQLKAWVKGVEHAKKQIRAAGFKVEGDV